jgi:hypothetical protein
MPDNVTDPAALVVFADCVLAALPVALTLPDAAPLFAV